MMNNSESNKQVAGSHTPGPWSVGVSGDNGLPCVDRIDPKDGSLFEICEVWGEENDLEITEMSIANARRIVACVNACEGIPTEKLEGRTIAEYVSDEAYLQGMQPSGDGFSVGLSGLACQMLASSFAGQFVGSRAVNYLEFHMENPEIGEFNVTIQRKEGKTPGQMKAEVEQQRDQLATKVADLELALFAENQKRADVERERDQLQERTDRAERALIGAGWTYTEGAAEWKPPVGPSASPLLERIDQLQAERDELLAAPSALEKVEGDLLPAIGDTVLIHLSSPEGWFPHRVAGYYVWKDHGGSKSLHRVFVRVVDVDGHLNARPLDAIRRFGEKDGDPC